MLERVFVRCRIRKRLRIRIQEEDVLVEEVHVKLTSIALRRFQRDESFPGIRFYLPLKYRRTIPFIERSSHVVPIFRCLIVVI